MLFTYEYHQSNFQLISIFTCAMLIQNMKLIYFYLIAMPKKEPVTFI